MSLPAGTGRDGAGGPRGSNLRGVRAHNERLVLSLLRSRGEMSKADLTRLTGLSAQTVSVIMRALEDDGLIRRGQPLRGRIGQPSVPLGLARDGAFSLGLKVGQRSLDLVLVDFLGGIRTRVTERHRYPTPDTVVRFAVSAIADILSQLGADERARIAGLGIAMPFHTWHWWRTLGVPEEALLDWRGRDIGAEIGAATGLPVQVQNDGTAACGAELLFGHGRGPRDFLYFHLGYFIGGGIVLNGSLVPGRTGNAGAIGSMPVPDGRGGQTVLLDIASLSVLERMLGEAGEAAERLWDTPSEWRFPVPLVEAWADAAGRAIAAAAAAAVAVYDFEACLVDGWMPVPVRSLLVERVRAHLAAIPASGIDLPLIEAGSIGAHARSLGAASLPLSARFLLDLQAFASAGAG
ncbi:ROK (Repressor, ORF, Kinase) domain protein [Azotobacter vinelandii CA]|uniref:ROK (Repressor, ORF, Kinase) domain protein n=2 Tax=Azotobacter vinelandii TaxID=354 RepID=C1DIC4_AZOVD|nr:ROK family transcriptional regulator [Azotobacter vinelandii]ACO76621.1 ROK (Repressor, ORF, Kinase) domain protein [Azotobacter vinelandii DJ]AGK15632.1 ROK (Repressor, ORF, Kinase) domain protein [Azotobacter vinelandii CA]AGK19244.1 ROK (Repressor, ORF, Kinase) domain protein [Azotobacter vinelandii CA6]WKN22378.1 ROK family transcriptional regulator [Azotobacter vinelandii]SFX12297.1 Sugar kinase of the NBD/HSP70 family, may contain an N-terminal HTH domain [Azotobacter vinelandii]